MKTTHATLLTAVLGAAAASTAQVSAATVVAGWSIDDTVTITADTIASDVTASNLTSPDWTLAVAGDDFFNIPQTGGMETGTDNNMAGAFTSGQFLEFEISTSDTEYDLDELQLTLQRASQGPQDWGLRISTDGFAGGNSDTGLAAYNLTFNQDLTETASLETISLSGLTLDASTTYTFRVAMDDRINNTSSSSAGRFYDIAVTAVPEPSSFALLAGCLALTSVMLRRRG